MPNPNVPPIRLVRFDCGCIGFPPVPKPYGPGVLALIVEACDSQAEPNPTLFQRDVSKQDHTDLPAAEVLDVVARLTRAIARGHDYDELRQSLTRLMKND